MMPIFTRLLAKLLRLDQFKYRSLTEGEILISKTVFGDLIDYQKVKVMNHPYLPWQPVGILMAPNGYIHLKDADYCEDFSCLSLGYQAVFIHEMAHVYQHQRHENVLLKGAILQSAMYLTFGKYNPYRYTFIKGKAYFDYNIEQQGDIAKDIYLNRIENIILNKNSSN
ncbi:MULTISPECIES: hypothetical protein [Acinetobacter]|uniref:Type IV secretion protein Rhs n=1 Tax=Acinetobacter wuhouensis TaxID=1879050 RepID=A0A3G2T4H9_9GAMM|nr:MULTISPECIES: hypothetical protein [Acinetobacter]AYO55149.1 hypothetical protein CDG68_16455 [Acinetobacter wuhouensis]RZG73821.1 hypothetical protein EXE09_14005 [Acinetobacter sp. WCHAc060025]